MKYKHFETIFKLILSIFIINSIVFVLFYENFIYEDFGHNRCFSFDCIYNIFKYTYVYYMIVYFFLAVTSGLFIGYSGLLDRNIKKIFVWILFLFILFLLGYTLYAANKYYWGIWTEYSFSKWIVRVFLNYIYKVPLIYTKQILLFIFITGLIIYRFIRTSRNNSKRICR